MSQVKFLHTADLHIGAELSYLENMSESRKYEVLEVFKSITLMCEEKNVEICLIAGDLFDSNAAAKVFIKPVLEYISSVKGTHFFLVCGNHDPLDAASPFTYTDLPENLTVFGADYQTVELHDLGVRIVGKSFSHSSMDVVPLSSMKQDGLINILLLHADFGAGSRYNPINQQFVAEAAADYVALGHIHKRTEVQKLGGSYIAYPGCPEGQGFDEGGKKGVYLGTLTKSGSEFEFVKTSNRLHITENVDISEADSTEAAEGIILNHLANRFGDCYQRNLYKLILCGFLENPEAIKTSHLELLLKDKLYFVKLRNKVSKKIDLNALSGELSLKGLFVKNMLERIAAADQSEMAALNDALYLGLAAFDGEVAYSED